MRTETVMRTGDHRATPGEQTARNAEEAEDMMPWACIIVDVDGGWMGFESRDDYETWSNQK